jgi:hypothetical protein
MEELTQLITLIVAALIGGVLQAGVFAVTVIVVARKMGIKI